MHETGFREVQRKPFAPWWIAAFCAVLLLPEVLLLSQEATPPRVAGFAFKLVFGGVLLLSSRMRMVTEVRDHALHLRYLPGGRRTIPVASIRSTDVVTYYPGIDGGWGVLPGRALLLRLESGESVIVGTQALDELQRLLVPPAAA